MCVIILASEENRVRPSEFMVKRAWAKNSDGGGIARRVVVDGVKKVYWKKGLNLEEMIQECKTAPLPFVAHFRIASANGGGVCHELCHPFPIAREMDFDQLEGYEDAPGVLFHNGDFKEWSLRGWEAALSSKAPNLPLGKWSDTRMLAWMSSFLGMGVMNFFQMKGVAFGPEEYEIFEGLTGWKDIEGLYCSNDSFWHSNGKQTSTSMSGNHMCWAEGCIEKNGVEGNYCEAHKEKRIPSPHRVLGPGTTQRVGFVCQGCHADTKNGQSHKSDCEYAPGSTRLRTFVCPECHASEYSKHTEKCSLKQFDESGGTRPADPFSVLMRAREQFKLKKISKKLLKKVSKRLGFHGGNRHPEAEKLKDPRKETVTH